MAESSSNSNKKDDDTMIPCPYDPTHTVKSSELQNHNWRYRCQLKQRYAAQGFKVDWKTCTKHCDQVLYPLEVEQHEESCFPYDPLTEPPPDSVPLEYSEMIKHQKVDYEAMRTHDSWDDDESMELDESESPSAPEQADRAEKRKLESSPPPDPDFSDDWGDEEEEVAEPSAKISKGEPKVDMVTKRWSNDKDDMDPEHKL